MTISYIQQVTDLKVLNMVRLLTEKKKKKKRKQEEKEKGKKKKIQVWQL